MDESILMNYLRGGCNDEECQQVELWCEEAPENRQILEQLYYTLFVGDRMAVMDAVDTEGQVLDDVTAVVSENIQAGTPENPVVTSLNITLKTSNPEAFQKLDGLKYSVSAHSSAQTAGQVLNKEQHLRLDKMVIKVKGGVTVDLN